MNQNGTYKQNKAGELSDYVFGKVQPQALDLEQTVLGALMMDKAAWFIVADILSVESFYLQQHQVIYKAMKRLFAKNAPIDLVTVADELIRTGELETAGNALYLNTLTNRVASSANIEYHARIVQQKCIRRKLIEVSSTIIRDAFNDTSDDFELLEFAEKQIFDVAVNNISGDAEGIESIVFKTVQNLETICQKPDGLTGVPSGLTELDRCTGGWQDSDLVIIAARPGMGKTGLLLTIAKNAAKDFQKGVAIFSLEMSKTQLAQRLISMESGLSLGHLRRPRNLTQSEWQQLHHASEKVLNMPLYIDDTPAISITEIRTKCRRLKMQKEISLVLVDYIQLMKGVEGKGGNRDQEIGTISRGLKVLAKELNVPVIALSQLSRAVETRGGTKRPQLSDLRESGNLEQDADIVSFIYRPEYYNFLEDEVGQSLKGIAEIIIAKHRNGEVGTIKTRFIERQTMFTDLSDFNFDELPPAESVSNGLPHPDSRIESNPFDSPFDPNAGILKLRPSVEEETPF